MSRNILSIARSRPESKEDTIERGYMPVGNPAWMKIAAIASVVFMIGMVALLAMRRRQELQQSLNAMALHVTPYKSRSSLLTPAEQRFYFRLFQAMGSDAIICPKVRLADVVDVLPDAIEWQTAWNRIAARQIDFLLVAPDSYKPMIAILFESGKTSRPYDNWLYQALEAGGLPILRLSLRHLHEPVVLRQHIYQKMSSATGW